MDKIKNDKMRKVSAILLLSANYGASMEDNLLDMWVKLLAEYTPDEVERGVQKVICEYEYKTRPPFAVLKKAIDNIIGRKKIDTDKLLKMEAEDAWDCLLEDISRYGFYKKPELEPIVERVLRGMGGWYVACNWETSKLEWKRKEFIERFELISEQEEYMGLDDFWMPEIASGSQSVASIMGITKRLEVNNE